MSNSQTMKENLTLIDVLKKGATFFQSKGVESSRLNMELILCSVLKLNRISLYLDFERPLNEIERDLIKAQMKRRISGEPLQHIIGMTNFFGLELKTDKRALIPRPETELLVERVLLDNLKERAWRILDIGSGSGAISLALAKHLPKSQVLGIDISMEAISLSNENARINNINNVEFINSDFRDFHFEQFEPDIIVSNPPYISLDEYNELPEEIKSYEPKNSLTDGGDGIFFYEEYAKRFREIIKEEGKFYLEIGYNQRESVLAIFKKSGFDCNIYNDNSGIPRIISYPKQYIP